MPRFHIGIDLGTTNCALAFVASQDPSGQSHLLEIDQPVTEHSRGRWATLPSFLYRPPEPPASGPASPWQIGRWARSRAAEVPGRVVRSAKSWLSHHAADPRAPFLPFGTTDLPPEARLSPVQASSLLLRTLAHAWDTAHPDAPLATQDVAITVPASFDPHAQQLTLEAALAAGFPETTLLLEEPQAAFYAWLETTAQPLSVLPSAAQQPRHVLVIDLGGGTTDLSLFALEPPPAASGSAISSEAPPRLKRIAVSEHLLLGGDNLDLALAHAAEDRLTSGNPLPPTTFAQLTERCREIKEAALSLDPSPSSATPPPTHPSDEIRRWSIAVARPGAALLTGTLRSEVHAEEVNELLLEGFFPAVSAAERPQRAAAGLREMGLPYARDPAVTRHLGDFLRGRPPVDAVLFNGGLTKSPAIRARLLENITRWQSGRAPLVLAGADPESAVARGAARFLFLRALRDPARIQAGAAHGYYVGLDEQRLLCVLPRDTPEETPQAAAPPGLRASVGRAVVFPLYRHARRDNDRAGDVVLRDDTFTALPSLETRLALPSESRSPAAPRGSGNSRTAPVDLAVHVQTVLRSTGVLRLELVSHALSTARPARWPLEFSVRSAPPPTATKPAPHPGSVTAPGPVVGTSLTAAAAAAMVQRLERGSSARDKLTAHAVFAAGEKALTLPKSSWDARVVRALFDAWQPLAATRRRSVEHDETWLQVAGFLLRPGYGVAGDEARIATLAPLLVAAPPAERASVQIQRWICARRIAAGLSSDLSLALWSQAAAEWPAHEPPSAETALLAGALEHLPMPLRTDLATRLTAAVLAQPAQSAFWKGLGRVLARVLLHAGSEQVLPPSVVEASWEAIAAAKLALPEPVQADAAQAWVRAARRLDVRALDVAAATRKSIDRQLQAWKIAPQRRLPLLDVVPVAHSDRAALLGEGLPPGLVLAD